MRVGVTGHRPNKLPGGYDLRSEPNKKIVQYFLTKLTELEPAVCCTGMALGADQLFAIACIKLNIPFIGFIPCLEQDKIWPKESRILYKSILDRATDIVYVSTKPYFTSCMNERNQAMVDWLKAVPESVLLAVWDEIQQGGTWDTVRRARLANLEISVYNPWYDSIR